MAGQEDVAGGSQFDLEPVYLAGPHQLRRFVQSGPEPGTLKPVAEVLREPVRVDVAAYSRASSITAIAEDIMHDAYIGCE